MVKLGVLTISGSRSAVYDGLDMGEYDTVMRFDFTDKGYVRKGKLFKTFDPDVLAQALGFIEYKVSQTTRKCR